MKNQLTIGVALACLLPGVSKAQSARAAVEAAETSFAAQAAQAGTAAAFVANSAPNGLVAEQGKLVNAQELWTGRPAKPGQRLAWYPVLADVSQTGDLGYTTGPWTTFQNNRPQAAGEYVTVWRKQPDGKFKFVVDMGIERVGTAPAAATVAQPRLLAAVATPSAAPSNILLDLDRKFAAAELLKPGATYQQYLSAEARLYRPGLSVMQGAAASANMKNLDGSYLFTATTCYLAAAGDLGYVVGTLRRAAAGAKHPEENGSYLRIWRREAVAGWRLVVEVFNLTPGSMAPAAASTPEGTAGQLPAAKSGQ
ncbi:nuclear transport factor 2 family protein [Hymenobacter antarcticus]|uniref:DUF4440 domain-containing protein n=1 Tax=Hymenobacter antarcticus TaxID=486270 RepID=A0ABP7PPV8_9BACT